MEKQIIENRAAKVLDAFRYQSEQDTYVDAVRLANFFGFTVEEKSSLPNTEDGSIYVSEDGHERSIVVNDVRSIESKRFIIVHELAHYLLHYTGNGQLFMHRENTKGKSTEENDADYLAACLLMPKPSFVEQYRYLKRGRDYNSTVLALQNVFCTPLESIQRRIDEVI